MPEVSIKLSKEKLIEGLSVLSFKEIKDIMDSLIQRKLFQPPTAKSIYKEASTIIERERLSADVAEEAVKWARAKK